MKSVWAYLFAACFVGALGDYATYPIDKPYYGPSEDAYEVQDYNRRCGVVPNTFQLGRAERSDTEFGEYPWQAAILNGYEKDSFVCSGALISGSDVLTSATCVKSLPESYIRVRLGEWDIATDRNPREAFGNLELGVVKKIVHPEYKPGTYDIAILKLEYPVDFSRYPQVAPVCLPSHAIHLEYAECFVAGWSESELNKIQITQFQSSFVDVDFIAAHKDAYKPTHDYKYKQNYKPTPDVPSVHYHTAVSILFNLTSVPLVTNINSRTLDDAQVLVEEKEECEEYLKYPLQYDQLCVSGTNGYDVCKADLGSPVACVVQETPSYSPRYRRDASSVQKRGFTAGPGSPRDSANARMVVVGVTSLVYPCSYKETPAVATDVIKSLKFILENIDIHDSY